MKNLNDYQIDPPSIYDYTRYHIFDRHLYLGIVSHTEAKQFFRCEDCETKFLFRRSDILFLESKFRDDYFVWKERQLDLYKEFGYDLVIDKCKELGIKEHKSLTQLFLIIWNRTEVKDLADIKKKFDDVVKIIYRNIV